MDEELVKFSRRALACKTWRWLPGMLGVRDTPPDRKDYLRPEVRVQTVRDIESAYAFRCLPDLSDAATCGAILKLIREAAKDYRAYLCDYGGYDSVQWAVVSHVFGSIREENDLRPHGWMSCLIGDHPTEGGALVISLEEAERFYRELDRKESEKSEIENILNSAK